MKQIEFIKEEFLKPCPVLYLCRGIPETPLRTRDYNTAVNIVKSDKQNEVSTLTFDIPHSKDRKITIDDCGKLILFENRYYIINEIETDDGDTPNMKISAESEDTELKGIYCEHINQIGASPYDMYLAIMSAVRHPIDLTKNYKWAGTDVVNKFRHLQCEEELSVYQNFVSLAEVFNGWLEITTDINGQNWIFLRTQEIDDGKFIKKNLDMKTLNITANSKEIFTQVELFGKADELTGEEVNIMSVNPNGQSYLQNYSYYISKGIPISNIDTEPKYQQLKVIRDEKYITPKDLYDMGIEELAKCSIPTIDASLSISDLSIYIDSPIVPPRVGHKLLCIDKDIDFIFTCRVIGVERPYSNPTDVKIEISNVNRYDTAFQNINHTVDNANKVISTDPTDTDGNNTGDSKPYIKMSDVKDGDHWNTTKRFADTYTLTTQTATEIALRVDEQNKSFAELKLTADSIASHVEDISDVNKKVYSEIKQTARNIKAVIVEGDDGSSVELSKDAFQIAFLKSSADITTIDEFGITASNVDGSYSRMGSKGLEHIQNGMSRPYHYLSATIPKRGIQCDDDNYNEFSVAIPPLFSGIEDKRNISVSISISKVYDSNSGSESLAYAFGGYASISNADDNYIQVGVMSAWRDYYNDSNDTSEWITGFDSPRGGLIDIVITLNA